MGDNQAAARERVLDVRGLEPPEPMERVLAVIAQLELGEALRMVHHREPFPLYEILKQRGFGYNTTALPDGHYEILIRR